MVTSVKIIIPYFEEAPWSKKTSYWETRIHEPKEEILTSKGVESITWHKGPQNLVLDDT